MAKDGLGPAISHAKLAFLFCWAAPDTMQIVLKTKPERAR